MQIDDDVLREVEAALYASEAMLVRVGTALPSSVVQKLPTKLLLEWEATEERARAALARLRKAMEGKDG